jgi:hypothetical protein
MKVQIHMLQPQPHLKDSLQKDGWLVSYEPDGRVLAVHPEVVSEPAARARLYRLGLLTSVRIRIHFDNTSRSNGGPTGESFGGRRRRVEMLPS